VEGKGEPLEVGEEPSSQGVNQLAADTRGDVDLQVGEHPGKDGDQNDRDRDRQQRQHLPALKQPLEGREVPWERFVRQYVVEDDRQRPGSQQFHQRHTQHTYSGEEQAPLRSAEVVQYHLPKPRVFGRVLWCRHGRPGRFRGLLGWSLLNVGQAAALFLNLTPADRIERCRFVRQTLLEPLQPRGGNRVGAPREAQVRRSYVTSLKQGEAQVRRGYVTSLTQVRFGCGELVRGEGLVELVGHLRVPRDEESAFALRPI
jgi:hypothetical protein